MKALDVDVRVTLAILRRHINLLQSHLYRLPLDLFPEIASHLANETDLVNATHVSHHLRNTLLSHPSLWSHLNFEHETRARAFFERSGRTPLHVDMARDSTKIAGSLAELRRQSNRIASLKLCRWPIQKRFLSEPLPSLKKLEIFSEHGDDDLEEGWDTVWEPVWGSMDDATSWPFPSLTSLIVYNLNPIPVYAPNLTCLKFRPGESHTDINEFLNFLGGCPLLEHIDFSHEDWHPWGKADLVVSLPSLRTYTQTALGGVCSPTVINALSLPPFCSVALRFWDDYYASREAHYTPMKAGNVFPQFENTDYLAKVKRVKVRATKDSDGGEIVGTLELINARGTRVCSERIVGVEGGENGPAVRRNKDNDYNTAHLDFLGSIDGRSVEIVCIDGCAWFGGVTIGVLKKMLGLGGARTLILSRGAVFHCLSALNEGVSAGGRSRWFLPIHTLIICPGPNQHHLRDIIPELLLNIAQEMKAAEIPFKYVTLFLCSGPGQRWDQVLAKLRMCVGELEVIEGDDLLDRDVDTYFLDGLDHLRKDRDVRWD